ncbi:MAG: peptidoglycan-associated lipoprotein Pal [Deltaproteobacteria bacterium]|jgi:peptidoglycan-associated lipoprotein|nr:peptidoglycan-associated lipoprotein Pal [Deltaproteobacteria bacterium]PNV86006.1 MAG: peptidoglycan-associated lipoprotein [Desulfobacteraceae bacterium]MDH3800649.1 peptidoglycan-associated lipoprotein Pal [Deltaproteobacteria bacterium]MDH3850578.1 peptidoglycan-associated lipoprotein Pal [Deltaproteobacteria bacterium]MDH3896176.1 peptidoglycan-associated lipoprotein Pal [Deltaproteobacteria bacterium]
MRKSRAWIFGAIMLAMLLALGVSCAKKQVTMETQEMAADESQQSAEDEAARREAEEARLQEQRAREARQRQEASSMSEAARKAAFEDEEIHFDFDKYVLTPQAMMVLDDKAAYLREHPEVRVLVEGHCDDRGSNEYNLALGDRRANSAKNYLVKSGVAESQVTTISYGEEQPLCMQQNESCWYRNRRGHFSAR